MRPGKYQSVIGGSIVLNSEGRLFMAENPKLLAGSAKSLIDCINYLITRNICPSGIAWDMASVNPLNLICPDDIHGLKVGARADLVLFTAENNRFVIKKTFKNGIKVYG
jgi:N-acetylglucosamine-6-phosphate deacetylase